MIKVLVAVGDPIAHIGLGTVLDQADDIESAAYGPGDGDIASAVEATRPDVLVVDVNKRREDPSLIPSLAERFPKLRIMVLVDHTADECAVRHLLLEGGRAKLAPEALGMVDDCCLTSLRNQATGCLARGAAPEAIMESVRAVARGEVVAAPWLSTLASSLAAGGDVDSPPPITPRELEVMALLAEGRSNKQIAKLLDIREQTVKNHVGRLMEKLGVGSRLEAGLIAAKHHLTLVHEEG